MGEVYASFFPTRQREYILIALYATLCLGYVLFGIHSTSKLLKAILKCAPLFLLLTFIIFVTSKLNFGPIQGKDDPAILGHVIFGLVFSFLGDLYLVFDSLFLLGLLSFAASQLAYIKIFGGWTLLFSIQSEDVITAVAIALVSAVVFFYILPKLSWVLVVPVALYCMLISAMLWSAFVNSRLESSLSTILGAIGACFFYTSDLLLAVNEFRMKIPYGPHLIIITYFIAQLFIPLHVIHRFSH